VCVCMCVCACVRACVCTRAWCVRVMFSVNHAYEYDRWPWSKPIIEDATRQELILHSVVTKVSERLLTQLIKQKFSFMRILLDDS
jgi:hypothetical protein